MKEKIKRFFIEKKELLIFIGIVVCVFAAVIGVASIALSSDNEKPVVTDDPTTNTPSDDPKDDPTTNTPSDDQQQIPVVSKKFALPIAGDYVMVHTFVDETLEAEELELAVISTGTSMVTSTGISYAKKDNSTFDVLAIYDGKVIDITTDELEGCVVKIQHSNSILSVYSSLTNVNVSVGDSVSQGDVIAKASTSISDTQAGVHATLEILVDNEYVNPTTIYGKELEEISSTK